MALNTIVEIAMEQVLYISVEIAMEQVLKTRLVPYVQEEDILMTMKMNKL